MHGNLNRKTKLQTELLRKGRNTNIREVSSKTPTIPNHTDSNKPLPKYDTYQYTSINDKGKQSISENPLALHIREVLTKTVKVNYANKGGNLKMFQKRFNDLKRKYDETAIQHIRPISFTRLQIV